MYIMSLNNKNYSIEKNNRKKLDGLEIDIYIKENNFAIEYNGMYWHSYEKINEKIKSEKMKERLLKEELNSNVGISYHLLKTKLAIKKDIQLFHIYEYEWLNPIKKKIIKSMIKNKLKLIGNKIFARNTYIKKVSKEDTKDFLINNHIQGNTYSEDNYGLYMKRTQPLMNLKKIKWFDKINYNIGILNLKKINYIKSGELVSIMCFSNERRNKTNNKELVRFCNLINFSVIGSASKLFKHYFKTLKFNEKIITFADLRYSYGDLYKTLGFKKLYITKPNYYYFKSSCKKSDNFEMFKFWKKENFSKKKIKEKYKSSSSLITKFEEDLTEYQNMLLNGYSKIYDCGKIKYEYQKK